jgi:hypothetical protein
MCSPLSELQMRKNNDPYRRRSNFDLEAFEIEEKWFSKRREVEMLDVAGMTSEMVEYKILEWLEVNFVSVIQPL